MSRADDPAEQAGGPTRRAAPWVQRQTTALMGQRGHAWVLQGPSGLGQYELALALVRAWLCDQPGANGACGVCGSCHAIDVHAHADLCVLMPETSMLELGWPLDEKSQAELDDKKRKPSREIRIEALRDAIEFAQRTDARGRGKAMLIYPAERMNNVAANALLKTLEEPPGRVQFVLASEAAHLLLPTIRSRCQIHTLVWPALPESLQWLMAAGLSESEATVQLRAAGGRPEDALRFARAGLDARFWQGLPRAMARGDSAIVGDWSPVQLINGLQKLCHDLTLVACGAVPRFFAAQDLPAAPRLSQLVQWQRDLNLEARSAEHPYNPGLTVDALVSRAQSALN